MNKVTHLVRWFLPFTASFIRNQIVYHKRYEPSLVYLQKKEGAFQREIENQTDTFCPVEGELSRFLYEKARFLTPPVKSRIKSYLKRKQPDVLHVHYGVDCLLYAGVIRDLGIPTCVSFYGYDCTSFPKRFFGYGERLLQRRVFENPGVKAVLAMSEDMKRDLIDLGCPTEKIVVHYYGTETRPFYQETGRREKKRISLLIISGLHEKKGHSDLLNALAMARETADRPIELNIVGDGPLRPSIADQIARMGLKQVRLCGPVRYGSEEHLEYLRRADVFVHPSRTPADGDKEGIPGALIEAMAAGLPVISTLHAGIPHVVENEVHGLLVPERNATALAKAILRLAQNDEFRKTIARAGQQHALHYLDVVEKEKELEDIYDALRERRSWKKKIKTQSNG